MTPQTPYIQHSASDSYWLPCGDCLFLEDVHILQEDQTVYPSIESADIELQLMELEQYETTFSAEVQNHNMRVANCDRAPKRCHEVNSYSSSDSHSSSDIEIELDEQHILCEVIHMKPVKPKTYMTSDDECDAVTWDDEAIVLSAQPAMSTYNNNRNNIAIMQSARRLFRNKK